MYTSQILISTCYFSQVMGQYAPSITCASPLVTISQQSFPSNFICIFLLISSSSCTKPCTRLCIGDKFSIAWSLAFFLFLLIKSSSTEHGTAKTRRKLLNWKGRLLNLARHATLIKVVLSALLACHMQTI